MLLKILRLGGLQDVMAGNAAQHPTAWQMNA